MGIPVYLDQDQDASSLTGNHSIAHMNNTLPPTLPPRHPHRRLTHYYQPLRHSQHPHHTSSPPSSQLEHLVGFSFRSDQVPARPPRQSSHGRVDTITPRRGSERSSILFRYYQQQQQAHHLRQSQEQGDEQEEQSHEDVDRPSDSVQTTLLPSPPTSGSTSISTSTIRPPSIPSRSRSRPPITVAVTSEPIVSPASNSSSSPLHSPSTQPWDHNHQLLLYERARQRRRQHAREQQEQYEGQLDAHQRRISAPQTRLTSAFSLQRSNTDAPLSDTDSLHQENGRRLSFSRTLAGTRYRTPRAERTNTNITIDEGGDKEKEKEKEKEHAVQGDVNMGSSSEATGTANLTINTSTSTGRSNRTSLSPTVTRNSVLPPVQPPPTSTTVATVMATDRSRMTHESSSIIIIHFEGQGRSSRDNSIARTSVTTEGGGGGDDYRDATQHHEQFRRAVQELAIPVREVCSLMPVLNAMCCIVEDPSGLWKLAQVPVVRHLWKGGLAGPSRGTSSAMATVQSALEPLSPSPSPASSPQQRHRDSRDEEKDGKESDDACAGIPQAVFPFCSSSSSCTALTMSSRYPPITSPGRQEDDEEDKERGSIGLVPL